MKSFSRFSHASLMVAKEKLKKEFSSLYVGYKRIPEAFNSTEQN